MEKALDLYKKYGNKGYIGEEITQLQHGVQAALLAERYYQECDDKLKYQITLGALFHDIGHLLIYENDRLEKMGDVGVKNHEELGAEYLKSLGFPELVSELARKHITTKRYLITTKEDYHDQLSEASKKTFEYQGGFMNKEEISLFEKNKYFDYHLRMRYFDDEAKLTDPKLLNYIRDIKPLEYYKSMILELRELL
jgi:2-amino-1-hydroxyethylphosphonate dioxygenase (glycine-forming)